MAYVKLYKAQSDTPIGYQTINQAKDNLDALRDAIAAEHAVGVQGGPGRHNFNGASGGAITSKISPLKGLGKHDDPRIMRAAAYVNWAQSASGGNYTPYLSWVTPQCLSGVTRVATGLCFFPVTGLAQFWATVTVGVNVSGAFWQVRSVYPTTTQPQTPGIYVTLRRVTGGVPTPLDNVPFSLHVYGSTE